MVAMNELRTRILGHMAGSEYPRTADEIQQFVGGDTRAVRNVCNYLAQAARGWLEKFKADGLSARYAITDAGREELATRRGPAPAEEAVVSEATVD